MGYFYKLAYVYFNLAKAALTKQSLLLVKTLHLT